MADNYGKKWSREETILAFDLYWRLPFSKISKSNKAVIELAGLIGRTPSSVGLKLANLAHFDPELAARNVKGMANASKLDKEIFQEFCNDWEALSYQAQTILAEYRNIDIKVREKEIENEMPPVGLDKNISSKARVGQYFFRMVVLSSYRNKCCITGINNQELLVASHIKPWAISDEKTERTNPCNGLCLNALHDKAFDRGLITIDSNYKIILSDQILHADMDSDTKDWFLSYAGKEILVPERFMPGKDFIEYHNDVIFQR
uniref:HNH endonuclease n=1 Tax=Eubacterium cellulosolvens TaxID=29322 RepID=UPI000485D269|nr:HNH endonuclease [[Eubacterium] cellulosolvens]